MTIAATELASIVGPSNVLTGTDAAPYLIGWREVHSGPAAAVVRPGSTDEVAAVVRHCAATGTPIVTQGGNTGMSGGSVPRPGDASCVVLSLVRLNNIESVDAERATITAGAGATIEAIQQAAAAHQLQFAPDWGGRGTATIGGGIATNAGGINVLRYGTMRPHVLGVEVVLPDGRVWDGLRALRKDSSGYDLKQLFIGSEGTLGIVTKAVVSLEPATPNHALALAAVSSIDTLMPMYALAQSIAPDAITAFELIPRGGLERTSKRLGFPMPIAAETEFYVLVKLAATQPVTDIAGRFLDEAQAAGFIVDAVVAGTTEQADRLWLIREELPPPMNFSKAHTDAGFKTDTAIPIDRIASFIADINAIAANVAPRAFVYAFGHIGDGNLHLYLLPRTDADIASVTAAHDELQKQIDAATISAGGSLSAEHGIGQELRDRIEAQKPAIEWELMRSIKAIFDPDNIMNPGKVLPAEKQ